MNITLLSIIVVIYLLAISYLAWRGYKATQTAADYMVAGRGVHPYIMALSYGATFISTSAIVGFGGVAGLFGLSLLWLTFFNIGVGIFIAFIFFGKRTRAMSHHLGAHTFSEFLGKRYKSKFIQVSTAVIILFMVIYAAAVLIGAGRHLEGITGISFKIALFIFVLIITGYVIAGGLKGVMYTDALQGSIMFVGMFLLLIFTLSNVGGFSKAHKKMDTNYKTVLTPAHLKKHIKRIAKKPADHVLMNDEQADEYIKKCFAVIANKKIAGIKGKLGAISKVKLSEEPSGFRKGDYKVIFKKTAPYYLQFLILNGVKKGGHRGWNSMPKGGTPIWWLIVSTIVLGVGIGVLAQPQLSVRFMTVKSNRELNRSVLIGGIFIIVMTGIAFVVGSLSNAYFFEKHQGLVAIGAAGGNVDKIIPAFLKTSMPQWFNYIFMLTLLSAAMSTLSSQFHAMGTAISRDIVEATGMIKPDETGGKKSIIAAKIGVGIMIIITVILGYILPKGVIAAATAIFFGLCASAFLPTLVGALYWKKATRIGAIASIATGFVVSLFWLLLVHAGTVKKLGYKSILGKSIMSHVDPLIIALPLSIIVFVVVSMFTKPVEQEHVDKCFKF